MTDYTQPNLGDAIRAAVRAAAEQLALNNVRPTIVLGGKTGAGKSSLINALVSGGVREVDVVPTTRSAESVTFEAEDLCVVAVDLPGFGEAGRHELYEAGLIQALQRGHLLLLVVGMPDRALEHEMSLLTNVRTRFGGAASIPPIIVAANKVDLAPREESGAQPP